jgi:hypothetical protein
MSDSPITITDPAKRQIFLDLLRAAGIPEPPAGSVITVQVEDQPQEQVRL